MSAHASPKYAGIHRFSNVVDRTRVETAGLAFLFIERGDKYHGDVASRRLPFEPATDLVTIHAWHPDVEQNEIRGIFRHCDLECLRAVGGDARSVFGTKGFDKNALV